MNKLIIKNLEKEVGTAVVLEEGLYYHIRCVCSFPQEGIYKLIVKCGSRQVGLGTCLFEQGKFTLEKRVSIRSLGRGELQIQVEQDKSSFYPIRKDTEFPYIAELSQKNLHFMNGEIGITLLPNQVPPDSDRSPTHQHV